MKENLTRYKCDGNDCDEVEIIEGEHRSPSHWIILENGVCYCSTKCFLSEDDNVESFNSNDNDDNNDNNQSYYRIRGVNA